MGRNMSLLKLVWLTAALIAISPTLSGQSSFRIDTDIYADIEKEPIMRSLTLFSEGVCYDFDNTNTKLVTIIDPGQQRIVLLNPDKRVKAEIQMSEIEQRLANATEQMTPEQKEAMARSNGIERDSTTGEIVVRNKSVEYRCTTQKVEKAEIAGLYCQFADWSARLNAIYPPHWPAYLRLELNSAVAAENAVPKDLQKITRINGKERRLTAKHISNRLLSDEDQKLIIRAQGMLAYPSIGVDQFIKAFK